MHPNSLIHLKYQRLRPINLEGVSVYFKLFLRLLAYISAHISPQLLKFKFLAYQILNFINIFLYNLTYSVIKIYNTRNRHSFRRLILRYVDCTNTFDTKPINQPKPTNFETNCYFARLSLCLFILYLPLF
jgi:hypothetical protein